MNKVGYHVLFWVLLSYGITCQAVDVGLGQAAPDCRLDTLDGETNSTLSKYRGKVVYVDFWASWCGPCAQSFPFMNSLYNDFKSSGLEIVGVNLDEDVSAAKGFLELTSAKFTILRDELGNCPQQFGVKAMPTSYLIDRTGVVRHIHMGFKPSEADELRSKIEGLLKVR